MQPAEEAYWDRYYRAAAPPSVPSQFAAFIVNELAPSTIADVGCGNGRDSLFFALHAERVLGFDRSVAAIEACNASPFKRENASFHVADVADRHWIEVVAGARATGTLLIYARFVLHALSEDQEAELLGLAADALTGSDDRFAVEFRTHLDVGRPKATAAHFRRFIDPSVLVYRAARHCLRPVYSVEGFGMAKYRDDDAHVARLIFERDG